MTDGKKNKPEDAGINPEDFDFSMPGDETADAGDGFDFEEMPMPGDAGVGGSERRPAVSSPVEDGGFDDEEENGFDISGEDAFGTDTASFDVVDDDASFAPQDGFGGDDVEPDADDGFGAPSFEEGQQAEDVYGEPTEGEAFADSEDPYGDPDGYVDPEDADAYAAGEEEQVEDLSDENAYAEAKPSNKGNLIFYGGASVAAVLVLGMGWTFIGPMLGLGGGASAPTPIASTTIQQQDTLGPAQPMPGLPAPSQGTGTPSLPPLAADAPATVQTDAPSLPLATEEVGLPPLTTAEENEEDPFHLDPVSTPVAAQGDTEITTRVASLEEELASLDTEALLARIAELEERLDRMEAQPALAATPRPVVTPPEKPLVLEDFTLRGVQGDVAWVDGPGGFEEVSVGYTFEEASAGTVTAIDNYENAWLVVTTTGVIVQE